MRFDPHDLHAGVYVYDKKNRPIGLAPCVGREGFGDTQAAEKHARARRRHIKAEKVASESKKQMDDLQPQATPADAGRGVDIPSAKSMESLFGKKLRREEERKDSSDREFHAVMGVISRSSEGKEKIRRRFALGEDAS